MSDSVIESAVFARVALDRIHPDPDQPRKTFDEAALKELAESIRLHGVVVPVKLRPHPTKNHGSFMLVAGERRWRASKLAGVDDIPAVIEERELSATEVLEQQIIENSQRADVPPLEEAQAYQLLLKEHGFTMELLIEKTGRSKAHLYGRLKLLELAPGAKKALQEGKLAPAIAELIARIGDAKLQEQCTKEVLGLVDIGEDARGYHIGIEPELVRDDDESGQGSKPQPLSYRAAQALIRRRYMTKLSLAKFEPADETLTAAGACTGCAHRSGNQPALPGLVAAKGDDVCTKPSCFEAKTKAQWERTAGAAAERGIKVIESADEKKVFTYDGVTVSGNSPYVELDGQLPYDLAKTPGSKATWSKLLGKAAAEVPRVLVQDASGAPRELLDKNAAVKKLRELGKVDKPTKAASSTSTSSASSAASKERAKGELNEAALQRVLARAAEKAAGETDEKKELAWMRWLARAVIRDYAESSGDGGEPMLKRRGIEDYHQLQDLAAKAKSPGEVRAILVELHLSICSNAKVNGWAGWREELEIFDEGCKLFGADWDKALEQAKDAAKAEAKADAAKDKKATPKRKGGAK